MAISSIPFDEKLLDHHNVSRYCGAMAINESNGCPNAAAFRLRDGENYLSVNWLECFCEHNFDIALIGIRCALIKKCRSINAKSKFATLNVGDIRNMIYKRHGHLLKIIRKAEKFDKSHTGIYVCREKALIVAHDLAEQVCCSDMYSGKGYEF